MIESLGSTRSTDERILDPDSELPLQIHARFVREHHTCFKRRRVSADEEWLLVTIKSETVANTVCLDRRLDLGAGEAIGRRGQLLKIKGLRDGASGSRS